MASIQTSASPSNHSFPANPTTIQGTALNIAITIIQELALMGGAYQIYQRIPQKTLFRIISLYPIISFFTTPRSDQTTPQVLQDPLLTLFLLQKLLCFFLL